MSGRHRMLRRHLLRLEPSAAAEGSAQLVEDLVAGWNDEQGEQRGRDDTADHCDAERRTELRTFTAAERHWQHTGDKRERRHQNRTQTNGARLDQRFAERQAALLARPFPE